MKKRKRTTLRRAAALLLTAVSVSAASAGSVDSSSFNAVTSGAISTPGTLGWGYLSFNDGALNGIFDSNLDGLDSGTSYDDTPFGSLTRDGGAILTTVGGSYAGVTLTEGHAGTAGTNVIDARGNPSNYTFDGSTAHGNFGSLGGSEQDAFTITFNDLGAGTFDITLFMGHSNTGRRFDMDYSLVDGGDAVSGTTSMGATTIGELGSTVAAIGTSGAAFTYNIQVTTTNPDADLSLVFGSLGGGSGQGFLSGYTVASADSGPADPVITAFSISGTTATVTISGDDTVGYWCASSTDLAGFTTAETALQTGTADPVPSNPDGSFNTTGGTLTFDVDVTGDDSLFLRIQDAAPGA